MQCSYRTLACIAIENIELCSSNLFCYLKHQKHYFEIVVLCWSLTILWINEWNFTPNLTGTNFINLLIKPEVTCLSALTARIGGGYTSVVTCLSALTARIGGG